MPIKQLLFCLIAGFGFLQVNSAIAVSLDLILTSNPIFVKDVVAVDLHVSALAGTGALVSGFDVDPHYDSAAPMKSGIRFATNGR